MDGPVMPGELGEDRHLALDVLHRFAETEHPGASMFLPGVRVGRPSPPHLPPMAAHADPDDARP